MKQRFKDTSGVYDIDVKRTGSALSLSVDGRSFELEIEDRSASTFLIRSKNRCFRGYSVKNKDHVLIQIEGQTFSFEDITHRDEIRGGSAGGLVDTNLVSPMPGSIIKVLVSVGDKVSKNQPLVIVEAMKMENEVISQTDAIVKSIFVETGQQVDAGQLLVELEPPNSPDE